MSKIALPFLCCAMLAAPALSAQEAGGLPDAEAAQELVAMAPVTLGDLVISGGFIRATLPNQPVASGFVTIANEGETDDRLVGVATEFAAMSQIHTMEMDGDVMRMRELADGIVIPAGESITLEPGGLHLMFMQLDAAMVAGESRAVTLSFAEAGDATLDLPVIDLRAMDMN